MIWEVLKLDFSGREELKDRSPQQRCILAPPDAVDVKPLSENRPFVCQVVR